MKRVLLISMCVTFVSFSGRATDPGYTNILNMDCSTPPPQIDATVFLNQGTFCGNTTPTGIGLGQFFFFGGLFVGLVNPGLSYSTMNTLSYTNNGLMTGFPGFELDYVTDDGFHHPAASIVNNNGNQNNPATIFGSQFVLLTATNLINRGMFEVGGSGLMQLTGNNINLSRSRLLVDAAGASGGGCIFDFTGIITPTNYFPEIGLDDIYWGGGTVTNLASDRIAQLFGVQLVVQSPTHTVTNLARPNGFGTRLAGMTDPAAFVLTNTVVNGTNTNWIVQAVFVGNLDTNISTQVRFVDNTYPDNLPPGNGFRTAIVELTSQTTNVVSGGSFTYSLYLTDQLATSTNRASLTNIIFGTQRPAPYILNSFPPCDFFFGAAGPNTTFTNTLLYDPLTYSNRVVTADYAAYEAGAFLSTAPTGFPVVYPTNSPGRVEITASNLDLSYTRIRGESIVTIKTPNLTGSTGALIEAPNLNYHLGSTNGLLSVSGNDLLKFTDLRRFGGFIRAWSALWTNFASVIVTNGTGTNAMVNTNQIEIDLHVLLVDGSGLATLQPALLNDFAARGTNIVLNDTITAGGSFTIDGDNLTVNGALNLSSQIAWASTNVHLNTLTNNGTINVASLLELGNDSRPYASVVNNVSGTISGLAVSLNTDSVQNSGAITANGLLTVKTRSGKFEGGQFSAGGDLIIAAQDLKLTRYQQSSVACYLAVTNSLSDSGVSASNILTCYDGFNLQMKPNSGDLLGTTLRSQAPQFRAVNNTWAAEDRGLTAAGFSDNAAIGRLIIDVPDSSFMTFSGTGASNALYVDFLDLRSAARNSMQSALAINTNLIIYFAAANVTAETLDGQFADSLAPGGRLRWVRTFAGPNSSVAVLMLNGQTIQTNRALRFSQTIDSDGDGVPNAFDFYPFDAAAWNSGSTTNGFWSGVSVSGAGSSRTVALSWSAASGTVYQVEFATRLAPANWQPLSSYTNLIATNGTIKILDTNIPTGELQRYYRMRYGP